ncbi:MAG: Hsp20/alpha crystallin family protein [Thermodesulfobacteriota bacterium]
MSKKQQKHHEKKKVDIKAHKAEPQLITHADDWYMPAADVFELENQVVIEVDMPGVSEKGVEMTLKGNELVVTGHVAHEEERDDVVLYREYGEGHFHRHFVVNETIDREKISLVISEGVLRITLPKKESYQPRRIEVKAG